MDSDKVLIMEAGTVMEFDHPYNLLQNSNGYFSKLVSQTGHGGAQRLYDIAEKSYMKKRQVIGCSVK